MHKTFSVNIGGVIFNVEEDAYELLNEYLNSIREHFQNIAGSDEIVSDIEARIAEQFLQKGLPSKIVTKDEVEQLIKVIGKVEDFDEGEKSAAESVVTDGAAAERKLFRDPDNKIIGGVAAGLAAYFSVDVTVVRLLFVVAGIFTSGAALLIYLVLYIVMPEAKTPTEKVQMRGGSISLKKLEENVREQVRKIKSNKEFSSTVHSGVERAVDFVGSVLRTFFKVLKKLVALLITVGSLVFVLAATFIVINLIFNAHTALLDFPIMQVADGWVYTTGMVLAYVIALLPGLLIFIAGIALLSGRRLFKLGVVLTLLFVWMVAVMAEGFMWVRFAPVYAERMEHLPQYQDVTRIENVANFDRVSVAGLSDVSITQGDHFALVKQGKQIDVDRTLVTVKDGELFITYHCTLCFTSRQPVKIQITMPSLQSISTTGMSQVRAENIQADNLTVDTNESSLVYITGHAKKVYIHSAGVSSVTIEGDADSADIETREMSSVRALHLQVADARITSRDASYVQTFATNSLEATVSGMSQVWYQGNPKHLSPTIRDAGSFMEFSTSTPEEGGDTGLTPLPAPLAPTPAAP